MSAHEQKTVDLTTVQRIHGEFMEMPGLRLTLDQAQRLWGLDETTCRRVLQILIDAGFLRDQGRGMFVRSG